MRRKIRIMTSLVLSIVLLAGCSNSPVGVTKTEPEALSGGDSVQTEQKESPDINENDGETAGNSVHHNIEEKNVPLYMFDAEHKEDINLYYVDGSEVPYISLDTVLDFLQDMHDGVSYELEYDEDHAIFTRTGTKLTCDFDFENDTIYYV